MDSLMTKCARALALLTIGGALASCGMSDDTLSNIIVAPPSAEYRNCDQLTAGIKASIAEQKRLKDLQKKAGGGIGAAIGATSYRPLYLTQRGSEINMRRSAREKGCKLPADLPPLDRQ
jgi:hypothetical protein